MTARDRLLPHPLISAVLGVLWLWLNDSLGLGHIVLGTALALTIPHLIDRALPPVDDRVRLRGLGPFAMLVARDIVTANFTVARLILRSPARLRPSFVCVPLDIESGWAITLLASTVSLTPGTVSAEVSPDRRSLLVHALTLEDDEDLARNIKDRYERPILELVR